MTFTPVIPVGGINGFRILQRTEEQQRAAHAQTPIIAQDLAYFKEHIGAVSTASDLVQDFRLLKVALGAFGLSDDINSKAFVQKILEEGTLSQDAFANKLTDSRYKEMSKAFGFDLTPPNTKLSTFAGSITSKYKDRSFEAAVGDVNNSMRLALNAKRELSEIAQNSSSDLTKWYQILGSPPLREVFETSLNLPSAFGSLDIEKQQSQMEERFQRIFSVNTLNDLQDPSTLDRVIERFLLMYSLSQNTQSFTPASTALVLLGG